LKQIRFVLPLIAVCAAVAAVTYVLAQPPMPDQKWHEFKLGDDITAAAGEVVLEPGFKAVADDRFGYEAYYNTTRTGTVSDAGKQVDGFRNRENWITRFNLVTQEDEQEGRTDLRYSFQFDNIEFLLDNGKARYSGYVGQESQFYKPQFHEIMADGSRNEVTNIPGWAGINARTLETNRSSQARDYAGSAWASITDSGRLYNESYFADYSAGDQRNYPGRLLDPVHLMLSVNVEFPAEAKLRLNEKFTLRRRLPVGASAGATTDYDVTYTLVKLYGDKNKPTEPTAARFTFEAVPAQREHTVRVDGMDIKFTAPDIKDGALLVDLVKGVSAHVTYKYALKGSISQPGTTWSSSFENEVDFTASLRVPPKQ
jgi:hypothetical protein